MCKSNLYRIRGGLYAKDKNEIYLTVTFNV